MFVKVLKAKLFFLSNSIIVFYPALWLYSQASSPPSCDSDYALDRSRDACDFSLSTVCTEGRERVDLNLAFRGDAPRGGDCQVC